MSEEESKIEFFEKKEETPRKSLSEILRDRWLNLMKGKEKLENFEEIDFNKILPDLRFLFGEEFEFKPADWWKTASVLDKKVLYYPRKFGRIPKDLPQELKEKQKEIQKGGLLHEAGHHLGLVKVLERFLLEADTQERILGDLSLGEVSQERIREVLERSRKELEAISERVNLGPYVANLLFLKDLHNLVLDIWLEAYEKNYPEGELKVEAEKGLKALNEELFPEVPKTLQINLKTGQQELLSNQFKTALLLKIMRPDWKEWGKTGYDLWFKKGFVSEEVKKSLENIMKNKALETLTETQELKEILMPKERIQWVKKKKLQEAYFAIRAEYIKLLLKDFEKIIEEKAKGIPQPCGGVGGGKREPINFDDLPPEIQEQILNQILEQIEEGEVGTPSLSEDDEEERRNILSLGREAIEDEIRRRREEKEGKKLEEKGEKKGESKTEKSLREQLARMSHERQIHAASEMERAALLGLSPEQLRIFEEKKREMAGQINYLTNFLVEILKHKMEPELKTHQPMGHLMPGRFPDYIRGRKEGKEPKVFQYLKLKGVMPAIDLLFLVDHSGSMSVLDKNKKAAETVLLFSEAFYRAEKELNKILPSARKKREYLREGLITFSDKAILRKPLDTPLDEKTIAQIFFTAEDISGGGTADAEALRNLIKYLKEEDVKYRGKCKVLKLVVVVTDGQGEREKVKDVLETAKSIKNTIFVAVGAGSDTKDVLDTYGKEMTGVKVVAIHIPDKEINQMPQKIVQAIEKPIAEEVIKL